MASLKPEERCTDIFYYVPEDLENPMHAPANQNEPFPEQFNLFTIPNKGSSEVTLQDIAEWFPLPGEYHFRFKQKTEYNMTCWLDVLNKKLTVPQHNGIIVMKVLRKNWVAPD